MCGICGYIGYKKPELLEDMCLVMKHRGPDDRGTWYDNVHHVGLGHCRLAIIDLTELGRQPMSNENGTIWMSYNGEIYNYQEYRDILIKRGHQFRGRSDTEVIVHMYEEWGLDIFNKLNGVFSFAIWDGNHQQLLLARDHAGVKPLYYWLNGKRIIFASEIKALLRDPELPREVDPQAIYDFLTFLWIPGERTLLKSIKKIEPGHYLIWKDGRIEIAQWFSLTYNPDEDVSEGEWVERVHQCLVDTMRRQMVSDVPVGAFLSGGADSSMVVACMRECFPERHIKCYTVCHDPTDNYLDQFVDDYPYAKQVAETFHVELESFVIKPNVLSLLPKMVYHLDEPDADPAVFPSYLISKFARQDGTPVLLSGTGGDEVFFGYRSHRAYWDYQRLGWVPVPILSLGLKTVEVVTAHLNGAQSRIPRRIRKFCGGLTKQGLDRHLALVDWSSQEIRNSIFTQAFAETLNPIEWPPASFEKYYTSFNGRGDLNRHSHLLIQTFLAAHNFLYMDKSSMAASIEVRVPFMDIELLKLVAAIPEHYKIKGGVTKYVLKKVLERYLPKHIVYRTKTGFGAPLRKWISSDLHFVVERLLAPKRLTERGIFRPEIVARVLNENYQNQADHAYLIYALVNLEIWLQTFIDRTGEEITLA